MSCLLTVRHSGLLWYLCTLSVLKDNGLASLTTLSPYLWNILRIHLPWQCLLLSHLKKQFDYVVLVLFISVRESACLPRGAARKIGKSSSNAVLTVANIEKENWKKKVQIDAKLTMSAKCWECKILSQVPQRIMSPVLWSICNSFKFNR